MGDFVLHAPDGPAFLARSHQRLIAYLAVIGAPERRESVAGTLWPDVPESRALGNLRSLLWHLRRRSIRVVADNGSWLWLDDLAVDISDVRRIAMRILRAADPGATTDEDVDLILNARDLLVGWSDEWIEAPRQFYRQLRVHALEALCAGLANKREFGLAIQACLAAVAVDPLREPSHRELIRAYLSEGNRADAVRQYSAYRSLMLEELNLPPSPEIASLLDELH